VDEQAGVREANWIVKKGAQNGRVSFFRGMGKCGLGFALGHAGQSVDPCGNSQKNRTCTVGRQSCFFSLSLIFSVSFLVLRIMSCKSEQDEFLFLMLNCLV